MRTWGLRLRAALVVALMFALFNALIAVVMYLLKIVEPIFYVVMAVAIMGIQYVISPKIVDFAMKVKYIEPYENPRLYSIVSRVVAKAGIPMPRIGISDVSFPNAFAYGRTMRDARVCVTRSLLDLLDDDELEAVIGHEIGHIKHRDMIIMTALSVIPLVCYYIYLSIVFSSYRDREGGSIAFLIGIGALIMYYVMELLLLYMNRVREYYADARSAELTGRPEALASALYKMARFNIAGKNQLSKEELKKIEYIKAFLAVKPSYNVPKELLILLEADANKDGKLDVNELRKIRDIKTSIGFKSRLAEVFSTHPNILKRIIKIADYLN